MTKVQVECKVSFILDIKEECSDEEIRELIDKNIENKFFSNDIQPKSYTYDFIENKKVPPDQISEGLIVEIRRKKNKNIGVVMRVEPHMIDYQILVLTKDKDKYYQLAKYDEVYYSNVKPAELIILPRENKHLVPALKYQSVIGYILDKNGTYKTVMVNRYEIKDNIAKLYIVHNGELSKPTYYEVPINQLQNFMVFE